MRLMLCGGTGFIGSRVAAALLARGDEVIIVTRRLPAKAAREHPRLRYVTWTDWATHPEEWKRVDGIVNLAGETINQRWTAEAKRRILTSRTQTAAWIADTLPKMPDPPRVVINASGISLYGHSFSARGGDDIVFDETSPAHPQDFLGETVIAWEQAADAIPAERLVKLRIGIVLDRKGGAFPLLRLPYRLFFGGRFGSGRQGFPWIHIDDMVGLILFCLDHPEISGPVNAVAPDPVTLDEFGRMLGKVMDRPHWFHVPARLARLALGERAVLLLTGQKAMPRKAMEYGYQFKFPILRMALRDLAR